MIRTILPEDSQVYDQRVILPRTVTLPPRQKPVPEIILGHPDPHYAPLMPIIDDRLEQRLQLWQMFFRVLFSRHLPIAFTSAS